MIILNVFLYFAGLSSSTIIEKYPMMNSRIFEFLGFQVTRVNFLIFNNFAYYSMFVGLIYILSKSDELYEKKTSVFNFIIPLLILSFLDARGPFIAFLFCYIFFNKLMKLKIKYHFFLIITIISIPLIINLFFFQFFDLSKEEILFFFSRRDTIWNIFFENYSPNFFSFLFGYGYIGQYTSGISLIYENLFPGWGNYKQISLHNSYLQILIDYGMIGFIIFMLTIFDFIKKSKIYLPSFIPVIYFLIITGVTDMSIQINNSVNFIFFIVMYNVVNNLIINEKIT